MCTFVFKGDFYKICGLLIAKQPHHLDRAMSMVHSLLQGIEEKVTAVTKCVPFVSVPTNNCFFGQMCCCRSHPLLLVALPLCAGSTAFAHHKGLSAWPLALLISMSDC